jgi:hypothetical protein
VKYGTPPTVPISRVASLLPSVTSRQFPAGQPPFAGRSRSNTTVCRTRADIDRFGG